MSDKEDKSEEEFKVEEEATPAAGGKKTRPARAKKAAAPA